MNVRIVQVCGLIIYQVSGRLFNLRCFMCSLMNVCGVLSDWSVFMYSF